MSLDLSKYGFIPLDQEEGKQNIDLSKYGFIPLGESQKKKDSSEDQSTFFGALGNLVSGGVGGVVGLPGDIASLAKSAGEFAAQEVASLATGKPREQIKEESRMQRQEMQKGPLGAVNSALGNLLPTSSQTLGFIDQLTGGASIPKGPLERGARTVGEFAGSAFVPIGATEKAGVKGLARLLQVPTGKELAGTVGAGVGTALSQELDGGVGGALLGGALGLAGGRGAANLASGVNTFAKKGAKGLAAKALGGSLNKSFVKEAKNLGIELTPGSILDSRTVQFLESKLAQSGLTGEKLAARKVEIGESLAKAFKKDAENLSKQTFETSREGLISLQGGLTDAREFVQQPIRELYQLSKEAIPVSDAIKANKLGGVVRKLRKDLSKTLLKDEATDAARTRKTLERLEGQLFDEFGIAKEISVQDLVGTNVDLNDLINFEVQGGSQQLLKKVKAAVADEILKYGKQNPEFGTAFQRAQKEFAEFAQTFRDSKDVNKLITSKTPGQLTGVGNNIDSVKQLERALTPLPRGKELLDRFKRFKLEEVLVNKVVDPTTGNVSLLKQKSIMKDANKRALIRELAGPEKFKNIERLSKLSSKLEANLSRFINSSNTATTLLDGAASYQIIKDIAMGVATLNPLLISRAGIGAVAPRLLGNLWADKAFIEELIKAGSQQSNKSFAQSFIKLSAIISDKIKELNEGK